MVMCSTQKKTSIIHDYKMAGLTIETVSKHPYAYLGITIMDNISWSGHINDITKKGKFSTWLHQVKPLQTYTSLVLPHLEKVSAAWDPHRKGQQDQIEKVQNMAARFITKDYSHESSVTAMTEDLNLSLLSQYQLQH